MNREQINLFHFMKQTIGTENIVYYLVLENR